MQEHARIILDRLGYKNIHFRVGDGYLGWPEAAPFDCIIVTAAPENVPQPLLDQLRDGGRMIIPIGSMNQDLVIFEKENRGSSAALQFQSDSSPDGQGPGEIDGSLRSAVLLQTADRRLQTAD